jgi:hypothetical protein
MATMGESKTFFDIENDKPTVESSDVDKSNIDEDLSLDEMYEYYIKKEGGTS